MIANKSSRQRPNVVVFLTDQQRFDSTGLHDNPLDLTPNFDRLAKGGTHVYNSITCQPICGPARSAMQTGLYPTVTGCWKNDISLPPDAKTLAHYFNEAGYHTGYVGKWHLGDKAASGPAAWGPVPKEMRGGYQYWLASNILEFTSDAYRVEMYDNDGNPRRFPGFRVDALTDAAIRYIDQHQSDPFFLFLSFIEPHFQNHRDDFPAPTGYRQRYTGRWTPPDLQGLPGTWPRQLGGYWGMCKRLDEALGRTDDCLRSLGLADDTILLFTSDHGCSFKTRIHHAYKQSCHESAVRVPTMFSGGPFAGGGQVQKLVSLIDLPPTLLHAAGIAVPDHMQGRSILPLLGGNARNVTDWPDDVFIQISESELGRAIRTSRWKYCAIAPDKNSWEVPSSDRYVESELYDLYADPYELNNLVGFETHRQVSDVLKSRLIRRMVAAGEAAPAIENAPARPNGQFIVYPDEINQ